MFTGYHFAWLAIAAASIVLSIRYLLRRKPDLKHVFTAACAVCVLSELIKTFSMMKMVPSADGTSMHMYIEMSHLPLHLCSLQILLIFFVRFTQNMKLRETILAFMYPTCMIGAFLALLIPTIFSSSIELTQAFTHPLAYQYFLYHIMLVVLGLYISLCGQVNIRPRHYLSTMGLLGALGFASLYLNAIFAAPTYQNGQLVSVDYTPNLFFTYETPLGIELTALWQWYLYLVIIVLLAALAIGACYLPFFRKAMKKKHCS